MTVINGLFAVGSGYPGCGFTRTVQSRRRGARAPRARRSLAATGSRVAPCAQRSRSEHSANTAQGHSVKRHTPEPARDRETAIRDARGMARGAPPRPETIERRSASRAAAAPAGRNVSKNLSPARSRMHAHAAADTGGIERLLLSRSLSSGGSSDLSQDGSSTPSLSATQS